MLPLDIHIEGQKVEILPEWREKIEAELGRLQKHYSGPILHARVEIIGTAHHHLGAGEGCRRPRLHAHFDHFASRPDRA